MEAAGEHFKQETKLKKWRAKKQSKWEEKKETKTQRNKRIG